MTYNNALNINLLFNFNPRISPILLGPLGKKKKTQYKTLLGQTCYSQTEGGKSPSVTVRRLHSPVF